jgi:hypothetical protein
MGQDEKDRKRSDENEVEAHVRPSRPRAEDEGVKAPEDKASDNEPDVEAHVRPSRP